jgi:hypothetical protein
MMTAEKVATARDFFYTKNHGRSVNALLPVTDYGAKFGPKEVLLAGANPTRQFVGSFTFNIKPDQNGFLQFDLFNRTSMTSLTYGYGPSWSRGPIIYNFGNMDQYYTWFEAVDPSRL